MKYPLAVAPRLTLILSLTLTLATTACNLGQTRSPLPEPAAQQTAEQNQGDDVARELPTPPADLPALTDKSIPLAENQVLVTLLATNDLHGSMESWIGRDRKRVGGMDEWGGYVQAVKRGLEAQYAARAGVMVLDAGDQFQGTLLSNFDEGETLFKLMDQVGYDAVIPGNHDYDFGPQGWLVDQVGLGATDLDPRGALKKLTGLVSFPLVSANTYLKSSMRDVLTGQPLEVNGHFCQPADPAALVDWKSAQGPDFLQRYLIKHLPNGARVAVIGIDNPSTPSTTTAANVSDLCFRDEAQTYLEVRRELQGQADVFVLLMHQGNSNSEFRATEIVERILDAEGTAGLHAVLAGHTHFVNKEMIRGVPLIQDGANGEKFGRIDLVFDMKQKRVIQDRTRVYAGTPIYHEECASGIRDFCVAGGASGAQGGATAAPALSVASSFDEPTPEGPSLEKFIALEGTRVVRDRALTELIANARASVKALAEQKIGRASVEVRTHRTDESVLANWLTDGLRAVTEEQAVEIARAQARAAGADVSIATSAALAVPTVAMLNTGGLRAPIAAGDVTYESLFRVMPFNNRVVVLNPVPARVVLSLLLKSAKTCGAYGGIMQSGLRVTYQRNCRDQNNKEISVDERARLVHVETLSGEVWVAGGVEVVAADRAVRIATLDFIAAGGDRFSELVGWPIESSADGVGDRGIARESLAQYFSAHAVDLPTQVDGRFRLVPQE